MTSCDVKQYKKNIVIIPIHITLTQKSKSARVEERETKKASTLSVFDIYYLVHVDELISRLLTIYQMIFRVFPYKLPRFVVHFFYQLFEILVKFRYLKSVYFISNQLFWVSDKTKEKSNGVG